MILCKRGEKGKHIQWGPKVDSNGLREADNVKHSHGSIFGMGITLRSSPSLLLFLHTSFFLESHQKRGSITFFTWNDMWNLSLCT